MPYRAELPIFEKKQRICFSLCDICIWKETLHIQHFLFTNSKHKQKPQALKKWFLFYMIFTFCDYCFLFFLKGHQVFCVVMPTFACLHHTIKAGTNTISWKAFIGKLLMELHSIFLLFSSCLNLASITPLSMGWSSVVFAAHCLGKHSILSF